MEASAIQAGRGLGRPRIALGTPLLRLRSDQQLVALFREGNEEAFRVIHDRYSARLLAYARQMLPGRAAEVEDALQDVFVRTYAGLRTSNRAVALRPWLYRVAYNRCIDELRRPLAASELLEARDHVVECDPATETEQRESLRRLVVDIGRLPEQQRSALLMREMSGMTYADVACALGVSVPAVKSLLVRARIGLAQALEARDTACIEIRHELAEAHEEGVRPSWMARRHLRDCAGCRACRAEMRNQGRKVAALAPTVGPLAVLAKLLGIGTGAGGGTATAAGAGGATAAGTGGTLAAASGVATLTVGHVATILAAVVTAGGAVAVQQTMATHGSHHTKHATHQAASAASAAPAKSTALRRPAHHPSPPPAPSPTQASPVRHAAPATSSSTTAPRQWRPATHQAPGTMDNQADLAVGPSASASSTTCTPPPPPACMVSAASSCPSDPGTSTSSSTGSPTGSSTTGTTTATGSGTSSGSATTAGTASGTGSAASAPTCQATTQPASIQGTEPSGTGQAATNAVRQAGLG